MTIFVLSVCARDTEARGGILEDSHVAVEGQELLNTLAVIKYL